MHLLGRHCNVCRSVQAKDLEAKLEAQTKRTQDAVAKAEAARSALKTSATAIATLEAQLAGLQVRLRPLTLQAAEHVSPQGLPSEDLSLLVTAGTHLGHVETGNDGSCQAAAAAQAASAAALAELAISAVNSGAAARKASVTC